MGDRWLETVVDPMREDGRITGYVHFMFNVTERVQTEQRLKDGARKLKQMMDGSIRAIASTLEMRDPYTAGHQRRVAQLACAMAAEMGMPADRIEGLRIACYVHDIGKIAVPAEILAKPSKISDHEFGIIKTHSQFGADVLKEIDFIWPVAEVTLQHHERLDGSGYPNHLKGEKIILEARILAVANVVEAMCSHRPYRPALGVAQGVAGNRRRKGHALRRAGRERLRQVVPQETLPIQVTDAGLPADAPKSPSEKPRENLLRPVNGRSRCRSWINSDGVGHGEERVVRVAVHGVDVEDVVDQHPGRGPLLAAVGELRVGLVAHGQATGQRGLHPHPVHALARGGVRGVRGNGVENAQRAESMPAHDMVNRALGASSMRVTEHSR